VLGLLTAISFVIDFAATALGAKRVGATKLAVVGAAIGTLGGMFLGLPGLILGPFVGAVAGEMLSHGKVQQAARGLIFGTLATRARGWGSSSALAREARADAESGSGERSRGARRAMLGVFAAALGTLLRVVRAALGLAAAHDARPVSAPCVSVTTVCCPSACSSS
jgi:hypothetical protein